MYTNIQKKLERYDTDNYHPEGRAFVQDLIDNKKPITNGLKLESQKLILELAQSYWAGEGFVHLSLDKIVEVVHEIVDQESYL
jgi:hypothetical protein